MTSTTSAAIIGASVVDYIHGNNNDGSGSLSVANHAAAAGAANNHESVEESPLRLPSLIGAVCQEDTTNILLRGPPQSGRTSLAMDMAHSAAAATSKCRGDCVGGDCRCVSVAILVPIDQPSDSFPIKSGPVESEQAEEAQWNKTALRRIQVHRMTSVRHVMEYLLSVQAKPESQQPNQAIIVDNVDSFVRGNNSRELTTKQLMTLTQLLAIFADTANVLRRTTAPSLSILATTRQGVSWNVTRLLSNWFPAVLTVVPTAWKPSVSENERVLSTFSVKRERNEAACLVQYAILSRDNETMRIVWTRTEPTHH